MADDHKDLVEQIEELTDEQANKLMARVVDDAAKHRRWLFLSKCVAPLLTVMLLALVWGFGYACGLLAGR